MPLPARFGSIFLGLAGFATDAGRETEAAAVFFSVEQAQEEEPQLFVGAAGAVGLGVGFGPIAHDVSRSIGATIPTVPFHGIGSGYGAFV